MGWGNYYMLPLRWKGKQWLLFAVFISMVVISARFDEPIRYLVFTIHGATEDGLCRFVRWFGTGWASLYLFIGLYACGLILNSNKARSGGLSILQSYLYPGAITISLKSIVGRWRPAAGHGHLAFSPMTITPNAHLSFPSGDVAVVWGLVVVMMSLSRNIAWKTAWILLAILTSLSRIYYDAHWFSDVTFSIMNSVAAGIWVVHNAKEPGEKKYT